MLNELAFVELFLGKNNLLMMESKGVPLIKIPVELIEEARALRESCKSRFSELELAEFSIYFQSTLYRVSVLNSIKDTVFVLRRFPDKVPGIETIHLHKAYKQKLMSPKLTGLLIISGAFGSGKTTTASSIVFSRISQLGGVAVTLEDPPEMPLEGVYNDIGVCYQVAIESDGFAQAVKSASRWNPNIIFLGEVRDSATAIEAINASVNGVLVVITIHGRTVKETIERLHSIATKDGDSNDLSSLISNGLRGVIHQSLIGDTDAKALQTEVLWCKNDDLKIQNTIREKQWGKIDELVQIQKNMLAMGKY